MNDAEFALTREQRDGIMRAVKAIERQLKDLSREPRWQSLYVITTNLAIIQTNVMNLPRHSSN